MNYVNLNYVICDKNSRNIPSLDVTLAYDIYIKKAHLVMLSALSPKIILPLMVKKTF